MPPKTDCSAITSCGGVRSNSAALFLALLELLGNSAMLISQPSHPPLTTKPKALIYNLFFSLGGKDNPFTNLQIQLIKKMCK
jgi:hypothetical protein